jgi:hypothetical protein
MAKAPKTSIDTALLQKVVAATDAGQLIYLSQAEGGAFVQHNPPLIEVNTGILDPNDSTKAAVRATQAAKDYLAAQAGSAEQTNGEAPKYAIITNAVLPEARKRGNVAGSGAPTKYPFADMPVGASFFSADSEHKNGNALKALGSTISSQNRKHGEETGETKTVKRAKLGPDKKPVLVDGKKVTETVTLPVLKYNRKFTIRPVVGGQKYGEWVAPANGALIARTI